MTLKWSIDQANGLLTFGKTIPLTGNTYDLQVSGQTEGTQYAFYVMDNSGEKCLARSERNEATGAYTIAFNQTELRRNFEKDWHEIRSFHTVVSDGTNTIAEGDLAICWNPVWTDPGTGEAYSMRGPQGIQGERGEPGSDGRDGANGVGIRSVEFSHVDGDGGYVYVITLDDGSSHDFKAPRGPQGQQGVQGQQGIQGPQGVQGPMGDGSYIFDCKDQLWHNVTVWTDPETGDKTVHVNPAGTPTRPGYTPVIDDELDTESENAVQNKVIAERILGIEEDADDLGGRMTDAEGDIADLKDRADDAEAAIDGIEDKIPAQATAGNKLADKAFVNSSIATNTAFFRGTSAAGLTEAQFLAWANSLEKTNNDYIFWNTTDDDGNVVYKRYKFNGTGWAFEYALNNSSFTAEQWAAIQSGVTEAAVTKLGGIAAGAQVNVIEAVKVGDETLPVTDKTVTIPSVQSPQLLDIVHLRTITNTTSEVNVYANAVRKEWDDGDWSILPPNGATHVYPLIITSPGATAAKKITLSISYAEVIPMWSQQVTVKEYTTRTFDLQDIGKLNVSLFATIPLIKIKHESASQLTEVFAVFERSQT